MNREPLFQELQSAEARIKALESELDANGLVLQKLQDERDKALERVDRLEEFLGVSEQAKTECIFGKNQPMTNPLTKELNERFYTLSVMEALGSIAPDQLRELDELSAIRDQDPEYEELANERNAKIQALFDKLGIKLSIPLNFQNHQ